MQGLLPQLGRIEELESVIGQTCHSPGSNRAGEIEQACWIADWPVERVRCRR